MVNHVILDTDIGGDPDDTFALLLALNSPEISLDLIVTSDEHRGHREAFANELLKKIRKSYNSCSRSRPWQQQVLCR